MAEGLIVSILATEGEELALLRIGSVGDIAAAELREHSEETVLFVGCPGKAKKYVGRAGDPQ